MLKLVNWEVSGSALFPPLVFLIRQIISLRKSYVTVC